MGKEEEKKKDILNILGQRLKTARKELELQQKDMAEALGISPSHLSEIEAGKSNPGAEFLLKLSEKFNISVEYIFHGRGNILYDEDGKFADIEYDFKSDVDDLDKLIWLLRNSPYFKLSVFSHATRLIHQEADVIKSSIKLNKKN